MCKYRSLLSPAPSHLLYTLHIRLVHLLVLRKVNKVARRDVILDHLLQLLSPRRWPGDWRVDGVEVPHGGVYELGPIASRSYTVRAAVCRQDLLDRQRRHALELLDVGVDGLGLGDEGGRVLERVSGKEYLLLGKIEDRPVGRVHVEVVHLYRAVADLDRRHVLCAHCELVAGEVCARALQGSGAGNMVRVEVAVNRGRLGDAY
ncbi:hypothetical protein PspLS_00740 [Pyricularia sp. CBS 133598]|nr:hypothetical protein PspLS_00740 [Pyricularia sp. CBS 133598]